jgi:DNA (cytosine-5)-methyltransferase 1
MNELALFAGAGGGILGGHLLGWRTVAAVEIEDYPRRILLQRQSDGILPRFPVWDDVQTFDGKPWLGKVDVISGGFPCQDISAAGKGAGIDGAKSSMWGHMARIIGEVRPRFVFVENSPLLVGRGLARVLGDLAKMGYDARWGIVGAHHAGAPHKRDRIWIVANANSIDGRTGAGGQDRPETGDGGEDVSDTESLHDGCRDTGTAERQTSKPGKSGSNEDMADSDRLNGDDCRHGASPVCGEQGREPSELSGGEISDTNCAGCEQQRRPGADEKEHGPSERSGWWVAEPGLGRVADGVACRVDRLKAIGNGQVPIVAALAWRLLLEGE